MKRAIKPLKYILLFKGCFIACVVAVVAKSLFRLTAKKSLIVTKH